jgi:hypothetical protein
MVFVTNNTDKVALFVQMFWNFKPDSLNPMRIWVGDKSLTNLRINDFLSDFCNSE